MTVGSLTSTPAADFEAHQTADGGKKRLLEEILTPVINFIASSDEEDEIIFSDDRGTDSDSLDENIDPVRWHIGNYISHLYQERRQSYNSLWVYVILLDVKLWKQSMIVCLSNKKYINMLKQTSHYNIQQKT